VDLTGKNFGRLTVICEAEQKWGHRHWRCKCECGRECVAAGTELKRSRTRSCGCVRKKITHGECADLRKSREYRIWSVMKSRCSNPKATGYGYYGAKGIRVCPEWRSSFEQIALIQPAAIGLVIADGQLRENRQKIRNIGEVSECDEPESP
jgi:hypothetical protein